MRIWTGAGMVRQESGGLEDCGQNRGASGFWKLLCLMII